MTIHDDIKENAKEFMLKSIIKSVKNYSELEGITICDVLKKVKANIDNCNC